MPNSFLGTVEPAALVMKTAIPVGPPRQGASPSKATALALEGFRADGALRSIMSNSDGDRKVFFVQYNPSKLKISGEVGVDEKICSLTPEGSGDDAKIAGKKISELKPSDVIAQSYQPAKLILIAQLVFDHTNVKRAFTNDNYSINPLEITKTVAGSIKDEKNVPTVQTEIEALMSMLINEYVTEIQFVWGTFCFSGTLQDVKAQYTMFDKESRPIRGVVEIRLLQSETDKTIDSWYHSLNQYLDSKKTVVKNMEEMDEMMEVKGILG